jgi:hypothetical protein
MRRSAMANFEVTTLTDEIDDPVTMSLREAIALANDAAGDDTITFASGLTGTLRLTQGEIEITDAVTINGGGLITITGDADDDDVVVGGVTDVAASFAGTVGAADDFLDDNSRLFNITGVGSDTGFKGLVLTGGRTLFDGVHGGAIQSVDSTVMLTDSTISGNLTTGDGAFGGGVAAATLTMTNSTISGNSTAGDYATGGGVYGVVTMTNSTISGNSTAGDSAGGGGVFGDVTLTNSTISGNATAGSQSEGGGVHGSATLTNSIITGNFSALTTNNELTFGPVLISGNIVGDTFTIDGLLPVTGITAADVFAETVEVFTDSNGDGTLDAASGVFAGVLADNGGPVQTMSLLADADNPALDAGDDGLAPALDAAGNARLDILGIGNEGTDFNDLGALELQKQADLGSLIVTTASDVVNSLDGETSLREAVLFANADGTDSTITFAEGLGTLRLTQGEIEITQALTIDGSGVITITGDKDANDVVVDGVTNVTASGTALLADNSRLFNITGVGTDTAFQGLVLTGGRTTLDEAHGGAIQSADSTVTLTNSTLSGNSTTGDNASGGGVYGAVTMTNSTISGNSTAGVSTNGGGVFGNVTMTNSVLSENSTVGFGGGVVGDVIMTDSTLSGNSTTGENGKGGGVFGDVTMTNSTLSVNSTAGDFATGGGVQGVVTMTNSTLSGNSTAGDFAQGGGVNGDLIMTNSTLSGNSTAGSSSSGGGVFGTATLTNSIITGNFSAQTTDNELAFAPVLFGGNIVGDTFTFSGLLPLTGITAANVFAETVEVRTDSNGDGTLDAASGVFAGVLADNGGRVQTIALLVDTSNPALDAGVDALASSTDAAGNARVDLPGVGTSISDLGALELLNAAPTFTSAATVSVAENTTAVIDVQASDDFSSEGVGLVYLLVGGADQSMFAIDAETGVLSLKTAPNFEALDGDTVFDVTVSVSDGVTATTQDLSVTIADVNEAPTFTSGAALTLVEGGLAVSSVRANDPDSDGLTYAIAGGADASKFKLDASSGALSFKVAPDFENPNDAGGDNVYDLKVTASDGSKTATNALSVTVTDFDEVVPPEIIANGFSDDVTTTGAGDDIVVDAGGDNTINSGDGNDRIGVLSGMNTLIGGAGDDLIIGGSNDDDIAGGTGNDVLSGDIGSFVFGADRIAGGTGDDLMMGGSGADVFVFATNGGTDTIGTLDIDYITLTNTTVTGPDFVSGVDRIDVSAFGFEDGAAALSAVGDVDGVATFSDQETVIVFNGLTADALSQDDFIFV